MLAVWEGVVCSPGWPWTCSASGHDLEPWPFKLYFPSAGITGLCHHDENGFFLYACRPSVPPTELQDRSSTFVVWLAGFWLGCFTNVSQGNFTSCFPVKSNLLLWMMNTWVCSLLRQASFWPLCSPGLLLSLQWSSCLCPLHSEITRVHNKPIRLRTLTQA